MIIKTLHPSIGAMIHGCNLNNLSAADKRDIRQAWLDHQVIFFPEQYLNHDEQMNVARVFGPLAEPHPFLPHISGHPCISVLEVYPGHPPGETFWHTDTTWLDHPTMGAVLYARIIPPTGGDTIWLSMKHVWQSLEPELQALLKPLKAVHALRAFKGSRFDSVDAEGISKVERYEKNNDKEVIHPVVAEHPETGEPTLYINEQFTRYIVGWSQENSEALLQRLFSIARSCSHQYRHRWSPNTIAVWDNRSTQHYAVTDYGEQHRVMHRVCMAGQRLQQAFNVGS